MLRTHRMGAAITAAAAIIALGIPTSAVADPALVTISGPTAAAWVADGLVDGFTVGLVATPANEAPITYAGNAGDPLVFDAIDRDTISGRDGVTKYGIGVYNGLISQGGSISSPPSEIGYYGGADVCGTTGQPLGLNCADQLAVTLDKPLWGGKFGLSFFYGGEQSGEIVKWELWRDDARVGLGTFGPAANGSYSSENDGLAEYGLPDIYWDEIRFLGADGEVADATDFLVEFVSGYVRPELGGDSATGSGTLIKTKGTWFMYNNYPADFAGDGCVEIQAGNPKDGVRTVGEYCIAPTGVPNQYVAEYLIEPTTTFGDFAYDIVVLKEHLAISYTNTNSFTGSPGTDDNADWGVPFTDADGLFKVFAHFSLDYI